MTGRLEHIQDLDFKESAKFLPALARNKKNITATLLLNV